MRTKTAYEQGRALAHKAFGLKPPAAPPAVKPVKAPTNPAADAVRDATVARDAASLDDLGKGGSAAVAG